MSDDYGFEQMSPLKAAATSMHELFTTLKDAGFSRRDALELIAKVMTGTIAEAMTQDTEEDDE